MSNLHDFTQGKRALVVTQRSTFGGVMTYHTMLVQALEDLGLLVTTVPIPPPTIDSLGSNELQGKVLARETQSAQYLNDLDESLRFDLTLFNLSDPGFLLPLAAHWRDRSIYILHTYPAGLRSAWNFRRVPIDRLPLMVAVSKATQIRVARCWWPRSNIALKSISVNYSSVGAPIQILSQPRTKNVLTVGHLVQYKDPSTWLQVAREVCSQLPDTSFTWLGDGPLLEKSRSTVRQWGLENQIFMPGYVKDVKPHFRKAAIYIQTSKIESLGLGVLEASRFGIPSVVRRTGGLPEAVLDGLSGFVVSGLQIRKQFLSRIVQLLTDEDLRIRMAAESRALYSSRFQIESWKKGIADKCRSILTDTE